MGKNGKLTSKQARFCQEYMVDSNGRQAAIRAGYAPNGARITASRLLTKINVKAEISKLKAKVTKAVNTSAENAIREIARIATVDIAELVDDDGNMLPPHKIPENARRAISSMQITEKNGVKQWRYTFADKNRALENLAKFHDLFTEHVDITSEGETVKQALVVFPDNGRG